MEQLAAHLTENYVLPDAPPPDDRPDEVQHPSPAELSTARLIDFGGRSEGIPAYCLFGDTGELSWLLHLRDSLAAVGAVLGIEAPGFGLGQPPAADIMQLAAGCADVIAQKHTGGPCRVVGHGMAGYVAAETARTLMHRGVEVAEILLIDTPEPALEPITAQLAVSVAAVTELLGAVWDCDTPINPRPDITQLDALIKAAAEQLQTNAPMDMPALHAWLTEATRWHLALASAARTYRPWPISGAGAVTVVRATGHAGSTQDGDFDRWIAPPPVIHDLDLTTRALVTAEGAQRLTAIVSRPASLPPPPRSAIVPINRYGVGPLSIWAHNLYGEVSYAVYLSKYLGANRPLIGLEQVGGDAVAQEYRSVREMAARYTAELRKNHGGEPFILGGCSFGGVLAYEIARQLQVAGEQVSRLIVIDPIMPTTATWDSVDWSHVTDLEAESFSIVMLGNASCQRWGVADRITLQDLGGRTIDEQLDVVAQHIISRSPARPDGTAISRQIRLRHELMMRNNVILQEYQPSPLIDPVATTLFHATRGFLAADNDNDLPAIPRSNADTSNGFGEYVGDRMVVHDLDADHFTIAYDHNLTRIAGMIAPLLDAPAVQASTGTR